MRKHFALLVPILTSALLLLSACVYNTEGGALSAQGNCIEVQEDTDYRELLKAMGYPVEELESLETNEVNFESLYNQSRFSKYTDTICNGRPIGESGKTISPAYYGGIYFDETGTLTVLVLDEAYNDGDSTIAIKEMRELGIIVKTSAFSDNELMAAINTLNAKSEEVVRAGACMWYLDTKQSQVVVCLDPFTDGQRAEFVNLLLTASIDPEMITIEPAVTQDMVEQREATIAAATQSVDDRIVHVITEAIGNTSIKFSLKNQTDVDFCYGAHWDMAYYSDGRWYPVQHRPGSGSGVWPSILYAIGPGNTAQFDVNWEWRFGELPPGRYIYILDGYFGDYNADHEVVYATVEFDVNED